MKKLLGMAQAKKSCCNFKIGILIGALFVYFRPLLITISMIQIVKSIDGALGIQTCSWRLVDADKTT